MSDNIKNMEMNTEIPDEAVENVSGGETVAEVARIEYRRFYDGAEVYLIRNSVRYEGVILEYHYRIDGYGVTTRYYDVRWTSIGGKSSNIVEKRVNEEWLRWIPY